MSAMLYELTSNAAQMCAPVPAAAAGGWVDLLDHWQTLLGAGVGGVMGVAGAWIVAVSQRRRDRRVAAGMILPDLQQIDAAGQSYAKALGEPPDANLDQQARAFFEKGRMLDTLRRLAKRRPVVFALHTPAIGQLSDVDARLYSHLFQCQMIHREFEDLMASRRPFGEDPLDLDEHDLRRYTDWLLCVEHAALARFWLENLVFSRWPRWIVNARLARHLGDHAKYPDQPVLSPDGFVKRSVHLLNTGEIFRPAVPGEAGQP